ncbi:MAG: hypothetical protein J6S67_19025 [Methanobrevibacter sp.]|nr:hypothetical protein [Methanobrevibacter sp.]
MGRKSEYKITPEEKDPYEHFYEQATEGYVKAISQIVKEKFTVEEDPETKVKSFKNSEGKTILSASTYDSLSFGLLAFLFGYHYQKKGE